MEQNNDGFTDSPDHADSVTTNTDNGQLTESGEASGSEPSVTPAPSDPVSDPVEDGSSLSGETDHTDTAPDHETDTEADQAVSSPGADDTVYLPELEYIDYLLNTQLDLMESTVSGNSINITLDSGSAQLLTDISTKQDVISNNQAVLIGLTTCILLAVLFDYMFHSARRTIKGMFGNKAEK